MSLGVTGCPTTAYLIDIFGEDYANGIAELYVSSAGRTKEQMVDNVWNVLYSFADKDKVKYWGMEKLQLDEEMAEKFSKIRLSHSFASLSLCAIRKILPWLETGMIYSHAVMMAKVPDIVGKALGNNTTRGIIRICTNYSNSIQRRIMQGHWISVLRLPRNNFDLKPGMLQRSCIILR